MLNIKMSEAKEMAELNKIHSNENEPVPVDFIDAMKIVADLNRAINTLALIGFNIEGSSDNAFGSCIWSALTNAENIIFRNMSYNPSNEVIENTIQDFINRQTYNAITEELIKCFYRTYSTKCCSMEFYDSMRKKPEAHHFDNLSSEEINKTCENTENKSKFVAYEIDWDIGIEDIYNLLDDMECREAAESLGISIDAYANMSVTDRPQSAGSSKSVSQGANVSDSTGRSLGQSLGTNDFAYDDFHHNRLDWEPYFNLPDEVEIPDEFGITSTDDDMQYVTDWLSDTYGFCIKGYKVRSKNESVKVKKENFGKTRFITTELKTHDGNYLFLICSNEIDEFDNCVGDFQCALSSKSLINNKIISFKDCITDDYSGIEIAGKNIEKSPELELFDLTLPEIIPYLNELKTSIAALYDCIKNNFYLTEDANDEEFEYYDKCCGNIINFDSFAEYKGNITYI